MELRQVSIFFAHCCASMVANIHRHWDGNSCWPMKLSTSNAFSVNPACFLAEMQYYRNAYGIGKKISIEFFSRNCYTYGQATDSRIKVHLFQQALIFFLDSSRRWIHEGLVSFLWFTPTTSAGLNLRSIGELASALPLDSLCRGFYFWK